MLLRIRLVCILLLVSVPAFAGPLASFTPEKSDGLAIVTHGDGLWESGSFGGRSAVSLKVGAARLNYNLYFKFNSAIREKLGADVYLLVDYYDHGVGAVDCHYNSASSPYAAAPAFFLLGSDKWERALIHLRDAKFAGLQNSGADFRLNNPSGSLVISSIEVYTTKPEVNVESDIDRFTKGFNHIEKPKGMYYTFGGDPIRPYGVLGVTSFESYVTWESCESKKEGEWDWSRWDREVASLKESNLKWVPFLILGPAYSTPAWFRESKEHIGCRCLEHGEESKIESLWNPNLPKRIDTFLSEFAKRYKKSGVVESVLIGIQGDFGEAIYSVWGGGWTFDIPGKYHNHLGYWCDDPYALANFRDHFRKHYKTIEPLNNAWGTSYKSFSQVDFPAREETMKAFQASVASGDPHARRRWLDFVDWYRGCMTDWADWWLAKTKDYFPDTPVYLCTGGDGNPAHGSNFAEQCRVAAKNGCGVRITNEASDYGLNFYYTRWTASAGKHYGAFFGFEPAGAENEAGIAARIYNATASGANQLHDYSPNVVTSKSRLDAQRANIPFLFHVANPIVPVAVWYPNVHMTLKLGGYWEQVGPTRDYTDFDMLDETMLRTNGLAEHKILLIVHGSIMETSDARLIADWIQKGGRVIVSGVPKFESVEGTDEPEKILFGETPSGRPFGKGSIIRVENLQSLPGELRKNFDSFGLPVYDLKQDGVYGTQIGPKRFIYLNTTDKESQVEITQNGKTIKRVIAPSSILDVKL